MKDTFGCKLPSRQVDGMLFPWLRCAPPREALDAFEPVYGLTWEALNDWLSMNPKMTADYERKFSRVNEGVAVSPTQVVGEAGAFAQVAWPVRRTAKI